MADIDKGKKRQRKRGSVGSAEGSVEVKEALPTSWKRARASSSYLRNPVESKIAYKRSSLANLI